MADADAVMRLTRARAVSELGHRRLARSKDIPDAASPDIHIDDRSDKHLSTSGWARK